MRPLYRSMTDTATSKYFQTYLAEHRNDVHAFEKLPPLPGKSSLASASLTTVFQYEVIREIIYALEGIDFTSLNCTCTKMIASDEWHFLCAPHADKPRDCSAIDYMKHTIDSTTSSLLNPETSSKNFYSVLRRLYRIYGHLYFHHHEIFQREKLFCEKFYWFLKEWGFFKQDMMIIPESVFGTSVTPSPSNGTTIIDLRAVTMQLSE